MPRTPTLFAAAALLAACTTNPVTGRQQLALVPEDQVIAASAQAYAEQVQAYRAKGKIETGTPAAERVRRIAARIVPQAERFRPETRDWQWQVSVIRDPQVNAFAMAGGKIAVYTGLLERLDPTDDELAQVIAHEIGHAISGHVREKLSVQMGSELAVAALGATRAGSAVGQQALASAAQLAVQLPNSRGMESEADRVGIELAARAGYDPRAALSLWQKMGRLQGSGGPEFLSTHPSDASRQQALSRLVPQMTALYEQARGGALARSAPR